FFSSRRRHTRFSRDWSSDVCSSDLTIIEAAAHHAHESGGWIAQYANWAVLLGAFVTSFYSFRLLYLTFFGKERFKDAHGHGHDAHHDDHGHHGPHEPHESPWVVTLD